MGALVKSICRHGRNLAAAMGAALLAPALAFAAPDATREHYAAQLVPESASPAPGRAVTLALRIVPKAGWHIYWSNPGESGYAPAIAWTMPQGFSAGAIRHPTPSTLVAGGLTSYVHEGETVLLQDIAVPRGAAMGQPVTLKADVDLLICNEGSCVPDPVTLDVTVTPGNGTPDPEQVGLFAKARAALPQAVTGKALFAPGPGGLKVFVPGLAADGQATLFLDQADAAKPTVAATLESAEGGVIATVPAGATMPGDALSGVLLVGGKGHAFTATRAASLAQLKASPAAAATGAFDLAFVLTFLTAVLGGLILNLMPCVFPILSLKALSLARYGESESHARTEALGYSLGTVGTVVVLGVVLLALRSGGSAAGWAFQLQNPAVVGALLLLVVGIATNLAGLYELPSLSVNGKRGSGFVGSMGTGALAAFIATPCTGPFMAGALGAALLMPPLQALLVMSGLGVGMALPFFVLGFVPAARRWIPRPGQWMVTLRHLLSVPMFATALGLAWIIGRQGGVTAMATALAAALVLGQALWWYGAQQRGGKRGASALALALSSLAIVGWGVVPEPVAASGPVAEADALHSQPFSEAKLAELTAQGKPVFLYLTADWCLSCKVNEATSLSSADVASAFGKGGVTVLRGDWTRQDPAISAFLKAHGRAGVPLYLWYPPHGDARELPQVLTPAMLTALVHPA